MTAKQYLHSVRRLDARMAQLQESIQQYWAGATSVVQTLDVDGGGRSSTTTRKPESYVEHVLELKQRYDYLISRKLHAQLLIEQLEDNVYAALLTAYYINGKTWEETAAAIGYSEVHTIQSLHPAALSAFQEILDKDHTLFNEI